jgi:hypothetical protein
MNLPRREKPAEKNRATRSCSASRIQCGFVIALHFPPPARSRSWRPTVRCRRLPASRLSRAVSSRAIGERLSSTRKVLLRPTASHLCTGPGVRTLGVSGRRAYATRGHWLFVLRRQHHHCQRHAWGSASRACQPRCIPAEARRLEFGGCMVAVGVETPLRTQAQGAHPSKCRERGRDTTTMKKFAC